MKIHGWSGWRCDTCGVVGNGLDVGSVMRQVAEHIEKPEHAKALDAARSRARAVDAAGWPLRDAPEAG